MNDKTILLHLIVLTVCVRWTEPMQLHWARSDMTKTRQWVNKFALLRPFVFLPNASNIEDFRSLNEMKDCDCPRVYWPCCAYMTKKRPRRRPIQVETTFVNPCISNCAGAKFIRPAACINFRRNSGSTNDTDDLDTFEGKIIVPSNWNLSDVASEDYRSTHNITLYDIRVILKALPDYPNETDNAAASAYNTYISEVAQPYSDQVVTFNDTVVNTTNPDEYILDIVRRYNLLI